MELAAFGDECGSRALAEHDEFLADDGVEHHVLRMGHAGGAVQHGVAFAQGLLVIGQGRVERDRIDESCLVFEFFEELDHDLEAVAQGI